MKLQFSQFFPLCLPTQPSPHSHSQSPHHCPCPWVLHTCSLTSPFTFFQPVLTSCLPLTTVSMFYVSMPLVLFCLVVYFVHQIPIVSEIIWYVSFTDWLISLRIRVSSSIHAVTKGKNSFFFTAVQYSIVLMYHSFLPTHLLMDNWAVPRSWLL